LSRAASPAVAVRLGYESFHFVYRQVMFLGPSLAVLFGVSLLGPRDIRRLSVVILTIGLLLVALTPYFGPEVKGAHRWIKFGPLSLQPSEFLKPAFVVVISWMFAEQAKGEGVPGNAIAVGLLGLTIVLLIRQPDVGQTVLISIVFGAVFFVAGLPILWVLGLGVGGVVGLELAYHYMPHFTSRVDRFLNPASGDTFQVDTARDAFMTGGLWGRGPGEGIVKRILPDAHTDYIFAVAGEEFGLALCLVLVGLFAFVVMRGFARIMRMNDHFAQLAGTGLVVLFGMQAVINMAVNLDLMPSKGMTLPFISYGGSSMLALALGMGMLLALTRRRFGPAIGGSEE
jgi:cell division protein FtsW